MVKEIELYVCQTFLWLLQFAKELVSLKTRQRYLNKLGLSFILVLLFFGQPWYDSIRAVKDIKGAKIIIDRN